MMPAQLISASSREKAPTQAATSASLVTSSRTARRFSRLGTVATSSAESPVTVTA